MRILYIANARIPTEKAHGLQIMQMCSAFAGAGLKVELVVPRRRNWIRENPFDYYGIKKKFEIKKLPCLDLITLDKYIGHFGLWVESFTFSIFLFPYILFKNADIIYTRDKFFLPFAIFKKNIVFEAHTLPKNYFLYSPFLRRVKKLAVITQKLKDIFVEQGIADNKILVAPDGVDLEKFNISLTQEECRRKLNLPLDKKLVLYTGHLYQWKGVQTLAEASGFLPENTEVYFVGGTAKDTRKFEIRNSKLETVHIVGHRPYSEIPFWLKAADVLVLPNSGKEEISRYWTSPLKMFEYMASKKPIVASDLPSIREILSGTNAVLVEPDNPSKLAEGIKKVLDDEGLSQGLAAGAFEDVQEYTWQKRAEKILSHIRRVDKNSVYILT